VYSRGTYVIGLREVHISVGIVVELLVEGLDGVEA
jgi:hypothetical protein